jgi:hypothetical protein
MGFMPSCLINVPCLSCIRSPQHSTMLSRSWRLYRTLAYPDFVTHRVLARWGALNGWVTHQYLQDLLQSRSTSQRSSLVAAKSKSIASWLPWEDE